MRQQEKDTASELYDRLWKVKSARFNAANRLRRTYLLSSYSTNLLSVYIIILSVFPVFDFIKNESYIKILGFVTVCVSIILLVFVLMESSMQYNLKSERFHDCGKKIDRLFKKFEFVKENKEIDEDERYKQYYKIQKKYDEIIELHENHNPIDFYFFQAIKRQKKYEVRKKEILFKLFEYDTACLKRWYMIMKYNHLIYIHYYFVIFILPILTIYLVLKLI